MNPLDELRALARVRDRAAARLHKAIDRERRAMGRLFQELVRRRREAGVTTAEVARRMNMSRPAVARMESPRYRANPRLETLVAYAAAVGVRLELRKLPGDWRPPRIEF